MLRRPFVKARRFWVEEALPAMAIGTARESDWFSGFGDGPIDAPGYMPAGGMGAHSSGVIASLIVVRGKYKEAPFSPRRGLYAPGIDRLCITGAAHVEWSEVRRGFSAPIDAPICFPAGACVDLSPFWFPGDDAPQMVVCREPWR